MSDLKFYYIREQIVKAIRDFFYEKNFHEVYPQYLNWQIPTEPNIYPFTTVWEANDSLQKLFLSTSPERKIKQMLGNGLGNCFSIGSCFRNLEGSGRLHFPEFTMLEWYRENSNYTEIMEDVKNLISFVKDKIDIFLEREKSNILMYQKVSINIKSWQIISLEELFFENFKISFQEIIENENKLFELAKERGYNTQNSSWNELFDQLLVNEIENDFPNEPFFLIDFPAKLSPLCQINPKKNYCAERFEFFLYKKEIGNGNNESTDYEKIKLHLEEEENQRKKNGKIFSDLDESFISSIKNMKKSSKKYAGIGLGLDRLIMIMADTDDIKDVI